MNELILQFAGSQTATDTQTTTPRQNMRSNSSHLH